MTTKKTRKTATKPKRKFRSLAPGTCSAPVPKPSGRRYAGVTEMLIGEHAITTRKLERRMKKLESAIRWALGEKGDFPQRQDGQGAYWWRTELRRRALPNTPRERDAQN